MPTTKPNSGDGGNRTHARFPPNHTTPRRIAPRPTPLNDADPATAGPTGSNAPDTVILDRRALRRCVQQHPRRSTMTYHPRRHPADGDLLDILAQAQHVAELNHDPAAASTSLEVELFTGRRFDKL